MKKLLLLGIAIGIYATSWSQLCSGLSWGQMIGQTYYDLHSNSSVGNRLVKNSDGSLSAVWIEHWDFLSQDNNPTGVRGFGYNHFDPASGWVYGCDGECWEVDNGCASSYVGWPEIVNIPNSGADDEIVISHIPLKATRRSNIGTGSWGNTTVLGIDTVFDTNAGSDDYDGTWPRAVSSGSFIHMIACFAGSDFNTPIIGTDGVSNPIRYYRSSDAGQTWDKRNVILPFDSSDVQRIGGDAYAIHSNGSTVAITCGAGIDSDWLMLKSTDNGNTWTKTTIFSNHNLDTSFIGANSSKGVITNADNFDIIIDNNGTVHVFAGMDMTDDANFIYADAGLYHDSGAGILYWKEGMTSPDTIAFPDYALDGNAADYSISSAENYGIFFQGWPAASFDQNGNLYLMYSAVVEGTQFINTTSGDTIGYNDLYMVYSLDNGTTWCRTNDPINVAEDIFGQIGSTPTQDDLYPGSVPEIGIDGTMHFTWQGDWNRPGVALRDDTHPNDNPNYIHYAAMNVSGVTTCATDPKIDSTLSINKLRKSIEFNLVPNPATNNVTITSDFGIEKIELINVYGQVVISRMLNNETAYNLTIADLAEGMYIVRIETVKGAGTKKLSIIK